MLICALLVMGLASYRSLGVDLFPKIEFPIVTVTTTILIFTLKIFDVVQAMTGGQFGTDVIGTQFYRQLFANRNLGAGSAIAVVLLVATIPIMVYNLRQMARQKTM